MKKGFTLIDILVIVVILIGLFTIGYLIVVNKYAERYENTMFKGFSEIEWISDPIKVSDKLREINIEWGLLNSDGKYVNGKQAIGFATINSYNNKCTIWAYEPKGTKDEQHMEILGHEVMHCFRGSYHK